MKKLKTFGVFSAGVIAGFLVSTQNQRTGQTTNLTDLGDRAAPKLGSTEQVATLRDPHERPMEALSDENGLLRKRLASPQATNALEAQATAPATTANFEEVMRRSRIVNRERDTQKLLAAGYTADQVEYFWRRAEELQVEFRRMNSDRQSNGLPPIDLQKTLGLIFDPQIALRYEVGDQEYEKFLTALERPTTVSIANVDRGSIADSIGIRPGDEIVAYDNVRVFNRGELDALTLARDKPSRSVVVIVRREGQSLQFVAPRGVLGVQPAQANLFTPP